MPQYVPQKVLVLCTLTRPTFDRKRPSTVPQTSTITTTIVTRHVIQMGASMGTKLKKDAKFQL